MSLDVALQSVAFYVLSCSTCTKINHRHKAKQQAKKERAEKQHLETEQPGLYRHPSPFSTNPYWSEEIALGPGPPKRKGGSKDGSSRALHTAGPGSSVMSGTTTMTDAGSSPTIVALEHQISGDNWNRIRYQREDEILWGAKPHPGQKLMDAIARAGSSVGITDRILGGRLSRSGASKDDGHETDDVEAGSYYIAKNPPLNDLHPPIVSSQPTHRGATSWMLQPPPPAKVMEGKERVDRSRSDSGATSRTGAESRQVSSKLVEAKLRRGETPEQGKSSSSLADSIPNPPKAASAAPNRDLTRSSSSDSSVSSTRGPRKPKRRPPPLNITPPKKAREKAEHIPIPSKTSEISTTFRLAPESRNLTSRPALATIASSNSISTHAKISPIIEAQPTQTKELSTDESASESPPGRALLISTVHHSFQGKDTFVFPPPQKPVDSKIDENERQAYDGGEEVSKGSLTPKRHCILEL